MYSPSLDVDGPFSTGCPKKVSIKNFYSDLFTDSFHIFEFIWIHSICKFCLVYHLIDLDISK